MNPITVLFLAIAAAGVIDAARRPASQWVAADRNRAFWIVMMVFLNILGVVAYVIAVVPRFSGGADVSDQSFYR